jgi:hypothetical protein
MRSTPEILDQIEMLMKRSVERPAMYAPSPEALENLLGCLDDLRCFIHEKAYKSESCGYCGFLISRGFGSSTFTSRNFPPAPRRTEDFELFAGFWKQYLASDYYTNAARTDS